MAHVGLLVDKFLYPRFDAIGLAAIGHKLRFKAKSAIGAGGIVRAVDDLKDAIGTGCAAPARIGGQGSDDDCARRQPGT